MSMDSLLKVKVIPNGALRVTGTFEIELPDGTTETKEKTTLLCRCGLSEKKPYCDAAHRRHGWEG